MEVSFNATSYHKVTLDDTCADILLGSSHTDRTETRSKILSFITQEDRKSIILQVLIEFGMLLRKKRKYFDAVYIFMAADYHDPERNIDAINNISTSLRKYIMTSDVSPNDMEKFVTEIQSNVSDINYKTLTAELKQYAARGNLYALREFIRWHCDCYVNKNKGIKNWIGIDSTRPEKVLEQLGRGLDDIIKEYGAAYEDTNNYHVDGIIGRIDQLIQINYKRSSSYSKKYAEENVQLLYLKGDVQLKFQCYGDAIHTFTTVCARKEANYIRRGKLGLKARYQLAQCHMARAEFRDALEILYEIRKTLSSSLISRKSSSHSDESYSDAAPDFRVDRDCGYCLMQLGSYEAACQIYEEIEESQRYRNYSHQQQIMNLNNYAACLIHTGDINKAEEILTRVQESSKNDKVTNLLRGYCFVCRDNQKEAQHYFDVAYDHDYDINPDIYGDTKACAQSNKAKDLNAVEQRSAYIINLTKIWAASENLEDKTLACKKINLFLSDISPACVLSLNATIALSEWLCQYEFSNPKPPDPLMNQLYRSFASVSVYPEHGSRAFQDFKADPNFRYFQSSERGKILARLFVMYRYIKFIKETLRFPHKKLSSEQTPSDHFFHYTNISTLKILLSEKSKDSGLPPRFRVCNCGYMNDVFEGNVFLDKIRDIAVPNTNSESGSQLNKWNNMVRKYFPHLVRSEENMIPVGKNVYIASLSRNSDSFPLWSIYADNETGCNIEFSKNFFDILEESKAPEQLQDYLISKYTDDDYPVYVIDYLDERGVSSNTVFTFDDRFCTSEKGKEINVFEAIYEKWESVDTEIENLKNKYGNSEDDTFISAIGAIYAFTSDRINEVRFLFKDADYKYEDEARVVVTTSKQPQIDGLMSPPRAYAEVNRTIDNICVRLGSKIDDATVDQLVTWLKLTGKVREVKLSKRNRRTIDVCF